MPLLHPLSNNPFPGPFPPPPPFISPLPPLHPRLTDSIDTQDLPHTTSLCQASDSPASRFFCVSFAARSDKKKGGKGGKREEEGRRGLVCHHRLKGKGRERGLRGGNRRGFIGLVWEKNQDSLRLPRDAVLAAKKAN